MISNSSPTVFFRFKNSTNTYRLYIWLVTSLLLFLFLLSDVSANSAADKNYLRIEQNKPSDKNDLKITSIGALAFMKDMEGHVDLTRLESEVNGNEWALDIGGGYVFNSDVSLYLGLGISLGYNRDKDDYIAAYFPEAGIVLDISNTLGITVSAKRFYNRYQENEDIVMMGLVFRD